MPLEPDVPIRTRWQAPVEEVLGVDRSAHQAIPGLAASSLTLVCSCVVQLRALTTRPGVR
ncbi:MULTISPECIES: hypothetical protein [Xanthomonas]|uniref:Uncharacterized protein n=1 Tax=Xanthomonas cucurbitae TaxID=56453 RepID=A0A2S7DS13_9XANT|nr:hypothetical protein [Xanthomonas cucurbitae]PPU76594.1 hypothetical protein XcuCFBP2542_09155 [Xanthomonas cucurbitae]QHG88876.1 hypothetical protein EBN15_19950 [Xanthomonas cucurbitae]WDM67763.1 hypothetical protein K6981_20440 [Xanthomonas cucurbitae]WDM71638.1 hypothetical protein K6978_20400 [Xanthomonas cucurbitae]WDM75481.1 hypothetical protein K6982_19535 [Xanthomonas cucurbitae]